MNNKYQEALPRLKLAVDILYSKSMAYWHIGIVDKEPQPILSEEDMNLLQELVDKEKPMKVENIDSNILFGDYKTVGTCPSCNKKIFISKNDWYMFMTQYDEDEEVFIRCTHCGNKLDWSEDEKTRD